MRTWPESTAGRRPRAKPVSAAAVDRSPDPRHGLGDGARRYVEVRDETDPLLAAFRVEEDALCPSSLGKRPRSGAQVHLDEEEVGFGRGAVQPANRLQLLREPAGALVVLGKPLEVVVERIEARRGEDSDLPQAAAEPLAQPPQPGGAGGGRRHRRSPPRPPALR